MKPAAGWDLTSASLVAPPNTAKVQIRMVVSNLNATIFADDLSFSL
jgi:hypothetical protein